jgi:hypothetical protein
MTVHEESQEIELPASAERVDAALVDKAVEDIREILGKTLKRGMEEVGTYLLRHFFDDDVDLCLSMSHAKHVSMRRLLSRCETLDFPVNRTFLGRSVRMAAMLKLLPKEASFRELPPSHRIQLLPLRDPDRVEDLASKAIARRMTVVKLRDAVHKAQEVAGSTRTSRTAPALRALRQFVKHLKDSETGRLALKKADVDAMDDEQLELARAQVRIAEKRLADMKRLLRD